MRIQKYGASDFKTTTWSGGTTTELFIYPPESEYAKRNFLLRLSSATVDLEQSEFTLLPGIRRFIAPLTGDLQIGHDGKQFITLKPYELYEFDGGIKTVSIGKVRDFNVMVQNDIAANVQSTPLTSSADITMRITQKEIGWLFSFDTAGELRITVSAPENNRQTIQLDPMTLLIFKTDSAHQPEEITVSTKNTGKVLYGTVQVR
ncbi:HutD family protein [Treponema phagedenis]|uniref:HutD family protein n=1 Tax=Treponema phagedenis TaxID=162 RepID=A0A0B7GVX5_TREPH|nr:HutD family protein [Treponema phagedenis]NVP25355.1 HutD family protein [Treponema phagedenis]QEJ94846.1 HutD family protein [Treponema phagedenis]QEJ97832.1 HutD family protein [Treponema phagedenis]QEK00747.1 HutD family protein [Treponema phagedenis]QEK03398.1 HutD family protein [Treponema phagedenis]